MLRLKLNQDVKYFPAVASRLSLLMLFCPTEVPASSLTHQCKVTSAAVKPQGSLFSLDVTPKVKQEGLYLCCLSYTSPLYVCVLMSVKVKVTFTFTFFVALEYEKKIILAL